MSHTATPPGPIVRPYLLVLFSVPFHVDGQGRRHLDPLWAKDLVEHTRYIERLVLAAPARHGPLPANTVAMDDGEALRNVRCVELPATEGYLSALRRLPATWGALWRATSGAAIVHCGVAGWPFPEAWVLAPVLLLRRCLVYINVESAFWRLVPGQPASRKRRIVAAVTERLNRHCVEGAHISTFTQEGYRTSLLRTHRERGHVVEASWIDAERIVSPEQLAGQQDRGCAGPLRLVFAGRLTVAKGVRLLLVAVREVISSGKDLTLDIYGDGPLDAECADAARQSGLAGKIRLHGSVPYDDDFFAALREYDVLVVPTLSDEQPRIVFDAYSQALPVLASDTAGMSQCVADGVTGRFFRSGDAISLRDAIEAMAADRTSMSAMAAACVARARASTHQEMHRRRWQLLVDAFPSLTMAKASGRREQGSEP